MFKPLTLIHLALKIGFGLQLLESEDCLPLFSSTLTFIFPPGLFEVLSENMAMSVPAKCTLCWGGVSPPHRHVKSTGIPKVKEELMEGLILINEKMFVRDQLKALTVKELKHLFKTHSGFVAHPACPCTRLSMLRVAELRTLCLQHNLIVTEATRAGEMQLLLRQHWEEQCQLAETTHGRHIPGQGSVTSTQGMTSPKMTSTFKEAPPTTKRTKEESQETPWELINGETGNEEVMAQISYAEEVAQQALTQAATLRQAHCLPPKAWTPPVPHVTAAMMANGPKAKPGRKQNQGN